MNPVSAPTNRNYALLKTRWQAIEKPGLTLHPIGEVHGYTLYQIRIRTDAPQNVLITTGIHGDEPAGPEAVLQFLEQDHGSQNFNFTIFPCLNPWGYVHNRRKNKDNKDINRSFGEDPVTEAKLVKTLLKGQRFDVYLDLHEDYDATGFYLYEGKHDKQWIGSHIIKNVQKIGPIDTETDENDIPLGKGHLMADPAWGTRGIVSYTHTHHADHVFIFETPTGHAIETRVAMHLTALDTVLKHYQR